MKQRLYVRAATKPGRILPGFLSLICLFGFLSLIAAQADSPNRAGLIVAHDGKVIKKCVEFSEEEINGYELLRRAGLELNVDANSGMGAAICRIDGTGCSYPEENCFCQCQGAGCRFWIYWHLANGGWQFSGLGASNASVRHGDVQGWIWGEGSPNTGGMQPPLVIFEEICTEPPPAPPSPTALPTDTPVPPTATAAPTPIATPIIHRFTADRSVVYAGESLVLSWDLSNARGAYLRYNGLEEGVVAPGSKTVSPESTTTYTLIARNEGGEAVSEITITVNTAPPTPTATLAAAALPGVQAHGPSPITAVTAAPEPVIRFEAGALILPPGACTSLTWQVQQASAVYLDDSEVKFQGSREVCPAHSRPYTLRVLYPGGERSVQVTMEVTESARVAPPVGLPSPTTVVSPVITVTLSATPSPAALALAPARPIRLEPERSAVAAERKGDGTGKRLLVYAGIVAVIFFFLVVPIALLGAGWVAWWLRRRP